MEGVVSFDQKMLLRTSLKFCRCMSIKVCRGGETKLLLPYALVNGHQDCECICLCLTSCCSEEIDAWQMSQTKSSGSGLYALTSIFLAGHHQGFATKKEKKRNVFELKCINKSSVFCGYKRIHLSNGQLYAQNIYIACKIFAFKMKLTR